MDAHKPDEVKARKAIRLFEEELQKRIHASGELVRDPELKTPWGPLSVPMVASCQGRSVAFDFENSNSGILGSGACELRDGVLMGCGHVQAVYYLRVPDLLMRLEDVMYGVSLWEPLLFDERSRYIVERCASARMNDLVRKHGWPPSTGDRDSLNSIVTYPSENEQDPDCLIIQRHAFRAGGRDFWSGCFKFAQEYGSGTFAELKAAWNRKYDL